MRAFSCEKRKGVKRGQPSDGLSGVAIARVFGGGESHSAVAPGERDHEAIILQVVGVQKPNLSSDEGDGELASTLQDDILTIYLTRVRDREGSSINPEALALATDLDGQRQHGGY